MEKRTVNVRGILLGDGVPKVCVPIAAADDDGLDAALLKLSAEPFDLLEYRADGASRQDASCFCRALEKIRSFFPKVPVLFTLRSLAEGGGFTGDETAYEELLAAAAKGGNADLVDVELRTAGDRAVQLTGRLRQLGVKVVGSWHDFEKTPSVHEMTDILISMQESGMDITKLAVMARCKSDVIRLLDAAVQMEERYADRPCITMAMGKPGQITRLLGGFTGSAVTFASAGYTSAPGQMPSRAVCALRTLLEENVWSQAAGKQ